MFPRLTKPYRFQVPRIVIQLFRTTFILAWKFKTLIIRSGDHWPSRYRATEQNDEAGSKLCVHEPVVSAVISACIFKHVGVTAALLGHHVPPAAFSSAVLHNMYVLPFAIFHVARWEWMGQVLIVIRELSRRICIQRAWWGRGFPAVVLDSSGFLSLKLDWIRYAKAEHKTLSIWRQYTIINIHFNQLGRKSNVLGDKRWATKTNGPPLRQKIDLNTHISLTTCALHRQND